MITGSHVVVYTRDADADLAFFRDTMEMPTVDAGTGWLIFALPPDEVAFHPARENNSHELYLMCDDLAATVRVIEGRGVRFVGISEERWGLLTKIHLPVGGRIGLY